MWTPPPGMLRPLGVGERIDASFKIWGRNFVPMAKAMLVIAVPAGIVEALIEASTSATPTTTNVGSTSLTVSSTSSSTFLGGSFLTLLIGLVVGALSITTIFRIVSDAYLGQPVDWRQALRAGLSRMLGAIWISILIGLVLAGVVLAVVLVFVIAAAAGSHALGFVVATLVGLAGMVFFLWFYVCAHLATPLLMLENARGQKAIARAIRLVRGSWWSVFGTELLMGLIVSVGGFAVGVLFFILLAAAHGDTTATIGINFLVRTIALVLFTPLSASIAVILAIDMRVRKEGFDIQYLAATLGTGHPGSGGPYAPPPGGQPAWGQPAWGQPAWGQPGRGQTPPGHQPPGEMGQVVTGQPQPEPLAPPPFVLPGSAPPSVPPPGQPPPPPPFASPPPASGLPFAGLPPPPSASPTTEPATQPPPPPPLPTVGPAAVPSLPLLSVPEPPPTPAPAHEQGATTPSATDDAWPTAAPEPPSTDTPSASGEDEAPADDSPSGPAPT